MEYITEPISSPGHTGPQEGAVGLVPDGGALECGGTGHHCQRSQPPDRQVGVLLSFVTQLSLFRLIKAHNKALYPKVFATFRLSSGCSFIFFCYYY